jgi:predicted DNA-binding transcriptional regulator AlpA
MPSSGETPSNTSKDVLDAADVAKIFGVSVQAVEDWRGVTGPEYFRTPGGRVRYDRSAVLAWKAAHTYRH